MRDVWLVVTMIAVALLVLAAFPGPAWWRMQLHGGVHNHDEGEAPVGGECPGCEEERAWRERRR